MSENMKKLLFFLLITVPLITIAQQPKMDIRFYLGFNATSLVYRAENVDSELLGGAQLGGGFRIHRRALMLEVDFTFLVQSFTYAPRDNDNMEIEEEVDLLLRGLEIPFLAGYIPIETPLFGLCFYGGLVNRFSLRGIIEYEDEEIKFNPKDAKLHVYNLGARIGTQIDLAMFNFELNYTIGITNSFRDRTRTNAHGFMLSLGILF
jgi:opacity protein-like surface antigen